MYPSNSTHKSQLLLAPDGVQSRRHGQTKSEEKRTAPGHPQKAQRREGRQTSQARGDACRNSPCQRGPGTAPGSGVARACGADAAGRRLPAIRFAPLDGSDGQFFLHEVWETREHHTAHTRTPHFSAGTPAKMRCWPRAKPPSGSRSPKLCS